MRDRGMGSFIYILALLFPAAAMAIETADILPAGIRGLSAKIGTMGNLDQYYSDNGDLKYLSDVNSVDLDVSTLENIDPAVQDLVNVLNQFGPDNLGDQLFLGRLKVDSDPEVKYFAPIFLYGLKPKLTVGVGIPVVKYTNTFGTKLSGSNLNQLRAEIGGVSPEVDAAVSRLNVDLESAFHDFVAERGYKPVRDRDESFIGDVQLIGVYRLDDSPSHRSVFQTYVSLPTGPKPDPDDLTDIEIFGRWSVKPVYIREQRIHARSKWIGALSYLAVLPTTESHRVPLNAGDQLPEASRKDDLGRDVGDTWAATAGVSWEHSDAFSTILAYSYELKGKDRFESSSKGDSALLEAETDRRANLMKIEFNYSTVKSYLNGSALVPASVAYEITQVVSGGIFDNRNVENQTKHELWLSLYF